VPEAPRLSHSEEIFPEELVLAFRNHGVPLEALRWPITPLGLHYLLTHYDIPAVDPNSWTLEVGGRLERPMRLSLEDLRARPQRTLAVTMECAGNGRARMTPRPVGQAWLVEAVGTAEWTGTALRGVLEEAGVLPDAVEVVFAGLDHGVEGGVEQDYQRALPMAEALDDDVLLVYEVNGVTLPPQHGFPLRLVVPGWYGMGNVKWLARITVVDEPFTGFQNSWAYRLRSGPDEEGVPVTRMKPRALMVPPGYPDFPTRRRYIAPGPCRIEGRAWSGHPPVTAVEVSTDGGGSWETAVVADDAPSPHAWQSWSWTWEAPSPGDYELCCRATDGRGHTQPTEAFWNLGGFTNNVVQRVPVTVLG